MATCVNERGESEENSRLSNSTNIVSYASQPLVSSWLQIKTPSTNTSARQILANERLNEQGSDGGFKPQIIAAEPQSGEPYMKLRSSSSNSATTTRDAKAFQMFTKITAVTVQPINTRLPIAPMTTPCKQPTDSDEVTMTQTSDEIREDNKTLSRTHELKRQTVNRQDDIARIETSPTCQPNNSSQNSRVSTCGRNCEQSVNRWQNLCELRNERNRTASGSGVQPASASRPAATSLASLRWQLLARALHEGRVSEAGLFFGTSVRRFQHFNLVQLCRDDSDNTDDDHDEDDNAVVRREREGESSRNSRRPSSIGRASTYFTTNPGHKRDELARSEAYAAAATLCTSNAEPQRSAHLAHSQTPIEPSIHRPRLPTPPPHVDANSDDHQNRTRQSAEQLQPPIPKRNNRNQLPQNAVRQNKQRSKANWSDRNHVLRRRRHSDVDEEEPDAAWYTARCLKEPDFSLRVRLLPNRITLAHLAANSSSGSSSSGSAASASTRSINGDVDVVATATGEIGKDDEERSTGGGADNTGNVCLWPSEEVLAYYAMKNKELFDGQTVIELGGGMTCLAGFTVAATARPIEVCLTDGNQRCVANAQLMLDANRPSLGKCHVYTRRVRWAESGDFDGLAGRFDVVLAADCLFVGENRPSLVDAIWTLLRSNSKGVCASHDAAAPHRGAGDCGAYSGNPRAGCDAGVAVVLAPTRGSSLQSFMALAIDKGFDVDRIVAYDTCVWELHTRYLQELPQIYDPDLHYPQMLILRKANKRAT